MVSVNLKDGKLKLPDIASTPVTDIWIRCEGGKIYLKNSDETENRELAVECIPLIPYNKLDTLDTPADGEVLSYNAANSKLEWIPQAAAGGYNVVKVTADYLASDRDCVLADASGGAITITLPTPSPGAEVIVKKIDSSTNVVTVSPSGTETIDGQSSWTLDTQYEAYHFISDGTNWYII